MFFLGVSGSSLCFSGDDELDVVDDDESRLDKSRLFEVTGDESCLFDVSDDDDETDGDRRLFF